MTEKLSSEKEGGKKVEEEESHVVLIGFQTSVGEEDTFTTLCYYLIRFLFQILALYSEIHKMFHVLRIIEEENEEKKNGESMGCKQHQGEPGAKDFLSFKGKFKGEKEVA